jgi:oligoribonuclease
MTADLHAPSGETCAARLTNAPLIPRPDETRLVWLDMEMSGLRPEVDRILEVAVVITDSNLERLAESEALALRQPDLVLDGMDAWNKSTHGRSGLVARVRASHWNEEAAERYLLGFIAAWVPEGKSPLCGNSIGQDRRFLARYMPRLERFFHYRNLDVSTIKELCRRWHPKLAKGFEKRSAHTALADIHESIDELEYYRMHFLRLDG